jgi:V-type H+-transporting ATPase subunit a
MTFVSVIVSEEAAGASIRELGTLGCLQFTDLNPDLTPFQRRFVQYIKRCDEIERKIRYCHSEVKKMNVPVQSAGSVEHFVGTGDASGEAMTNSAYILEHLEEKLEPFEQQLLELNRYSTKLTEEYNHKVEYHHLLVKSRKFLGEATDIESMDRQDAVVSDTDNTGLMMSSFAGAGADSEFGLPVPGYQGDDMVFSNIAGVLPSADKVRFERMIYRATRGNCYVRFSALSGKAVDAYGEHIDKMCFIIFYKSAAIETKIKKICDAFCANRYDLRNLHRPVDLQNQQELNHRSMVEAKTVLDKNTETRLRLCVDVAASVEEWLWLVKREKGIYHTLNLFKNDVAANLLRGRAWILTDALPDARRALKRSHESMNLLPTAMIEPVSASGLTAPTHFATNKFTWAFQEFVNTYGVPHYKEINPALFTAATFPFFFGVMYGDIGHGTILAMGGLYLILTESNANKRGQDEMVAGIYSARYMLFAMGMMAVYAGFIYNDYFSLGLDIFGSRYEYQGEETGDKAIQLGAYGDATQVYPFGADPAWKISGNDLLFFNSMKMKMSVVLGITQMIFGIMLRGTNALYFKNHVDFVCDFIPMIIFAFSLFGYMVILIFTKWSIDWQERMALGSCNYDISGVFGACNIGDSATCYSSTGMVCDSTTLLTDLCPLNYGGTGDGCQPPNLITTLINIALKPGDVDEPMYEGQAAVQTVLILLAFICVPWLLMAKPFYLKHLNDKAQHGDGGPAFTLLMK